MPYTIQYWYWQYRVKAKTGLLTSGVLFFSFSFFVNVHVNSQPTHIWCPLFQTQAGFLTSGLRGVKFKTNIFETAEERETREASEALHGIEDGDKTGRRDGQGEDSGMHGKPRLPARVGQSRAAARPRRYTYPGSNGAA